jgi:hypothetical protein
VNSNALTEFGNSGKGEAAGGRVVGGGCRFTPNGSAQRDEIVRLKGGPPRPADMPVRRNWRHAHHELIRTFAGRRDTLPIILLCGSKDWESITFREELEALKVTARRCPERGAALTSQSTISRPENAPSRTELRPPHFNHVSTRECG